MGPHKNKQTSVVSILSSEHGRMRRKQRDISKRDLQKAIKYGRRERCWGNRWKIEHDGIVFITNDSLRHEVTAYAAPLKMVKLDNEKMDDHIKAKHVLDLKPHLSKSHTILVVDNSGSMGTHDIPMHRDRQVAAYSTIALEFVAAQLANGTANNSDVVSLVEFSNSSSIVFAREPVSWVLYNLLLSRQNDKIFKIRENARMADTPCNDSNYLPALDLVESLLLEEYNETCVLSVFFLSDGAPTDARHLNLTPMAAQRRMCQRMEEVASRFGSQLQVKMVGFGNELQDFSVLEAMANAVNDAPTDATAEFLYCEKLPNAIGRALTSLATSITASRTSLMGRIGTGRTRRNFDREEGLPRLRYHKIINHYTVDPKHNDFVENVGLPPGAIVDYCSTEVARRPPLLAISTKVFDSGVERVAFRCQLADNEEDTGFRFGAMVAKETMHVERIEENVLFHLCFLETQSLAASLADEFNRRLNALPSNNETTTPCISFLQCSVLLLEDDQWPEGRRGVLVEKMLDTEKYGWCKWNDNAGTVGGRVAHIPIDVDREFDKINRDGSLDAILEGDSEDEESEVSDLDIDEENEEVGHQEQRTVKPSDYLQAFTHFTYRYTNQKVMVCDLQGVYNVDAVPPTFELTDPAIHYNSKRGREMVYGRTDKGRAGMKLFFNTHKCTSVCKALQLNNKNKQWRQKWRQETSLKIVPREASQIPKT